MRLFSRRLPALVCVAGLVSGLAVTRVDAVAAGAATADDRDLIARGAYLAKAADCGACHTVAAGKSYAGGLAITSPVGVIYSTNITPSMEFGIGHYSYGQFAQALRKGIRGDGANLYPAMPYTSYSLLTDSDVRALYAFFMKSVVPIDRRAPRTELSFPLNIRLSMKVWDLIFLNKRQYEADATRDPEWNRGRYLVRALAHCGECHTPRGLLMQTRGDREFAGAQVGPWHAPNITADVTSGLGSWTTEELARYFKSGVLIGKARAAGSMAEAVEDSFQYMTDADLRAMATYVLTVPAVRDKADIVSRFSTGAAFSELATLRGANGIRSDNGTLSGAELYESHCAACHAARGTGTKDGYYPSLFDNSALGARNPNNLIATILFGVNRTTRAGQAYMPGFGGRPDDLAALSDDQIAVLGNYLIEHFGRGAGQVKTKEVAQVRRGGPRSFLPMMARVGVIVAAAAAIFLVVLLVVRRRRPHKSGRVDST